MGHTLVLKDGKTTDTPGEMNNGQVWAFYAIRVYNEFKQLSAATEVSPLSEEGSEALEQLQNVEVVIAKKIGQLQQSLEKAKADKKVTIQNSLRIEVAYRILISNCAVLLYLESDSDIVEVLDDLCVSYKQLSDPPKSRRKSMEASVNAYDVVTDIIVSLLTRSSAFLRTIATRSFSLLSPTLPESSIQILIGILDPAKQSESDVESDEEMDDESDDDGVPFTLEEAAAMAAARGEDDDSDDDSDDSDMEGNPVVDEALEAELIKLQESDGTQEDIYIEDAPLEELKEFNEKLKSMLATMKTRQRQTDEKQTLQLDHRAKVIDLLEAYLRHQPQNPLILSFLQPLCRAIIEAETNKSSPTYLNKLRAFVHHKVIKVTNLFPTTEEEGQDLLGVFELIAPLCVGSKKVSALTINVVHDVILFVVRLLVHEGKFTKPLVLALRKSFKDSAAKPLKHFDWALWSDLVKRSGDQLAPLAEDIVSSDKLIASSVKPFALCKTVELYGSFCKHHSQALKEDSTFVGTIGPMMQKLVALLGPDGPNLNVANRVVFPNTKDLHSLQQLSQRAFRDGFIKGCSWNW